MCNSMFNFKKSVFFQSSFMFIVKLRPVYTDFSCTSCPHTCIGSLIVHIPQQSDAFVTINEFTLPYHITQGPQFTSRLPAGHVHSMGLAKRVMMGICRCGTVQCTVTDFQNSSVLLLVLPFPPLTSSSCWSSYSLYSLTFPECHIVGVVQYVAFSDWPLSLSNMHVRFLCIFKAW